MTFHGKPSGFWPPRWSQSGHFLWKRRSKCKKNQFGATFPERIAPFGPSWRQISRTRMQKTQFCKIFKVWNIFHLFKISASGRFSLQGTQIRPPRWAKKWKFLWKRSARFTFWRFQKWKFRKHHRMIGIPLVLEGVRIRALSRIAQKWISHYVFRGMPTFWPIWEAGFAFPVVKSDDLRRF